MDDCLMLAGHVVEPPTYEELLKIVAMLCHRENVAPHRTDENSRGTVEIVLRKY